MKKLTALLLIFIFAFSAVCVNADVPKFLLEEYNNYSADYSFSLEFESTDKLVSLLKELEMPDEIENFVDIKALISSILSQGLQMQLQANISNDLRKAEVGLCAASQDSVTFNPNFTLSADSKLGMWIRLDLDAQIPVYEIVYSAPFLNKYMVIDVFEMMPDDETKLQFFNYIESILNSDFLENTKEFSTKLLEEHADIKLSGAVCSVKFDNDALITIINEFITFMAEEISPMLPEYADTDIYSEIPKLGDIQLLGENGITYKYSLVSGKISNIDLTADISINIPDIVAAAGGEWGYESDGILDFMAKSNMKLSKIGNTKVDFPVLNEQNSFSIMDMMPEYTEPDYDYGDYEEEYPYFYTSAYTNELPVLGGEIYVPLRALLEDAYGDTVNLEYENGIVNVNCQHFNGFTHLKLTENSGIAYTDNTAHKVSKVIIINGTTYVGRTLFEDLFGWEMDSATHDMLYDEYYVSFYTSH